MECSRLYHSIWSGYKRRHTYEARKVLVWRLEVLQIALRRSRVMVGVNVTNFSFARIIHNVEVFLSSRAFVHAARLSCTRKRLPDSISQATFNYAQPLNIITAQSYPS